MNIQPVVSIICTVYNKAPWLKKTIESLLSQETDFLVEILLIDDASTDGSDKIIEEYVQKYPDKIRAFYNTENLGIAKTWVLVCKEAKGKYIARCDGDDFWIDPLKLSKQVALLEASDDSKWSNTDFDIYDEKGSYISSAGFESGMIPLADSFEKMLATRGFTMASTWLVERSLMLEVNDELDLSTADDTFNLQLDLFQKTKLTYLPESTVAYVINQGSDSRPKNFENLISRFNHLLQTQYDYIDKYPQSNYREMIHMLLARSNHFEIELARKRQGLSQIGIEKVTIYLADENGNFCEDNIVQFPLELVGNITFEIPENCHSIRVDLTEKPSFYKHVVLTAQHVKQQLYPTFTNGILYKSSYLFPNGDPQIIYETPNLYGRIYHLNYELYELDALESEDYIGNVLTTELPTLMCKVKKLEEANEEKKRQLEEMTQKYHTVISSRRWTIPTSILNFFRRNK